MMNDPFPTHIHYFTVIMYQLTHFREQYLREQQENFKGDLKEAEVSRHAWCYLTLLIQDHACLLPVIQKMLEHEQEANEKEQLKRKGQVVVYGDYIQVNMIIDWPGYPCMQ